MGTTCCSSYDPSKRRPSAAIQQAYQRIVQRHELVSNRVHRLKEELQDSMTPEEMDQILRIETKRKLRSTLTHQTDDLQHYREMTFHIPDDDAYYADENPSFLLPNLSSNAWTASPTTHNVHQGLELVQSPSSGTYPKQPPSSSVFENVTNSGGALPLFPPLIGTPLQDDGGVQPLSPTTDEALVAANTHNSNLLSPSSPQFLQANNGVLMTDECNLSGSQSSAQNGGGFSFALPVWGEGPPQAGAAANGNQKADFAAPVIDFSSRLNSPQVQTGGFSCTSPLRSPAAPISAMKGNAAPTLDLRKIGASLMDQSTSGILRSPLSPKSTSRVRFVDESELKQEKTPV